MYRELNDYELLYVVSEDNKDSFQILLSKYQPLIRKEMQKYCFLFQKAGYELEDLLQIGYITLYRASILYTGNDSMFYTYFSKALYNAIFSEYKSTKTAKKELLNQAFSYDREIPNSHVLYKEILGDNQKKVHLTMEMFIRFKNSMSFDLGNIFSMYYEGYNFPEIAHLLDLDIHYVRRCFLKIKQHALTYKGLFFA